ncbi:MAG: 4Fe-4S dicluster domain-containing protein [Leptospiraceae bacterium]|nr:4Fe-4S dicluster domain-containing protein [Leptospiraceae bacterium]
MTEIQNFQEEKKQHWQSLETKDRKDLKQIQNQEFFTSPDPVIDRIKTGNFDRNTFLKLMGASLGLATANCIPQKPEKIVPYVNKPEFATPGLANYYASTSVTGNAILVKTKDGRPLKLEGNPSNPATKGALSARDQASILDLYDPDREKEPLKITSGTGAKIAWKDLDDAVKAKLAETKGKTRILSAPIFSPTTKKLINDFFAKVGGGELVEFDPISPLDAISEANAISYGKALVPNYHFEKAKVVLSIEADFIGTWISPVEFSSAFTNNRNLSKNSSSMNQLIVAESIFSVTGSNADLRVPLKAGDSKRFAIAIAKAIGELGGNTYGEFKDISLAEISKELEISEETIKTIAKKLYSSKGESLVVAGGTNASSEEVIELQIVVNLLNSMLDNEGKTVDAGAYRAESATYYRNLAKLKKDLEAGQVGVLFVHGLNPVFQLPETAGWKSLLSKAGLLVSLADRLDETAAISSYLASSSHNLETWGDWELVKGTITAQQPTIQPLYNTRSFEDSLITWANGELDGQKTFYEYLKSNFAKTTKTPWVNFLRSGQVVTETKSAARTFKAGGLTKLQPKSKGLTLALYTTVAMADGSTANNPVLLELPDPISKVTWDNYVSISPKHAQIAGIKSNDVVSVKVGNKEITLPVLVQPGLHDETVAIGLGFGRTHAGKVGNGVGKNTFDLVTFKNDRAVFAGVPVTIEKTGKTYKLASTQDHHMMNPSGDPILMSKKGPMGTKWADRPLIQSTSFDKFKANPESGKAPSEIPLIHKNGKKVEAEGFNPPFEYKGNRWGMSIDLSLCTGCSACVVACQIENNIPVVGRDEVRVGREMHWIRIDRYYIGDPEKPQELEIGHQPVMCQHCENAPCETVCPVAATVHGSEGTNDMVYNRCVGTRYCSNNCPYKVRRFNWMEHWKDGKDTARSPRNLAFNPEVTVRSRGVMEKCTFCSSRIAEKKFKAKNEGRALKDGELKTACQETCPSNAISFGNTNDKESMVSKLSAEKRSYRILDFLNIKPQVAYLTRVKNYAKENA